MYFQTVVDKHGIKIYPKYILLTDNHLVKWIVVTESKLSWIEMAIQGKDSRAVRTKQPALQLPRVELKSPVDQERHEMRLTLYTDYSLRVLLYLASKEEEIVTITELADFYNISRNHLVKVVHNLGLNGYILTIRGRHGGIKLARPAKKIPIGEVVRSTEPDFDLLECFNPATDRCVITRSCSLKSVLFKAQTGFLDVLDKHTLADIAKTSRKAFSSFRSIPIMPI
jgi:Rrf2 family nitric oxide-sensitive transcriptional repressor